MAAPFIWGAGGAQLTPEQIAADRKVASAMMQQGTDYSPVRHWTQGAARVAQALLGGAIENDANNAVRANAAADRELLGAVLAGQGGAVAPASVPSPVPASGNAGDAIASIESGGKYDTMGPVTKTGDRAFGKYQVMGANIPAWSKAHFGTELTPEQFLANPQAQDAVFKGQFGQYSQKYGPEGAARAWFAGEGGMNNPNARDQLGTSVADYGKRFSAVYKPDGVSQAGEPTVYQPSGGAPARGINPAVVAGLSSPYISSGTKSVLSALLQNQLQGDQVSTVDLGGSVGVMDKRGNIIRQLPKGEPVKAATYGVIGEDAFGNKTYGWINPRDKSVAPYTAPNSAPAAPPAVAGPDGKPIPVPAGANPKVFRDEITRINADSAGGKKTEVQANAEQFANRMEDAEKNIQAHQDAVAGLGGAYNRTVEALPFPSSMQTSEYQQFNQARSQFITALLRKESGAAINKEEFTRYDKEFFPQPGDSKDVIEQKRAARSVALAAMKKGAGPGYKPPETTQAAGDAPNGVDPKVWAAMTPQERALWK